MAKNKYVAGKIVVRNRFDAPNQQERLTITVQEGKGRFNLKASIKSLAKDADKARPGCRESFDTVEKAKAAFEKLVKTAADKGWKKVSVSEGSRNAFTTIPDAPTAGAKKSTAKPAHSQPTKAATVAAPTK